MILTSRTPIFVRIALNSRFGIRGWFGQSAALVCLAALPPLYDGNDQGDEEGKTSDEVFGRKHGFYIEGGNARSTMPFFIFGGYHGIVQ
jgi:hypothetical protein